MEVFSKLKCENPGPFNDLKVKLVSMTLTDAHMSKEIVEGFIQKMKGNKPDGSFVKQFTLFIKKNLRWLYSPANFPSELAGLEPLYDEVATELATCCVLIYNPLRQVLDLEYRANHPWTKEELKSAIEKETIKYLFELVEFSLNQVGMAEEAEEFKGKVKGAAAGVENFQSVKLCKDKMLPIESHKVKVVNAGIQIPEDVNLPTLLSAFPTPPSNWKSETSANMTSHNEKVTEAVTAVEGSGGKRKAAADAGGAGQSSLKKLKPF